MSKLMLTTIAAVLIASPSLACAERAMASMPPVAKCGMQENVSININYNFKANSFAEAKKMFDDQNAKVSDFAKKQEVKKFELQNQNYNIYSQPMNYGPDGQPSSYNYQVNGSSTYVMDNAEAAFKFAEYLTTQKIQVGLNSNSYKNGTCN